MSAFGGGGTQNGTWFVGGGHRHTWQDDHIRYLVAGGYADVNLDIYSGDVLGFGNNRAVETETRGYGGMQKLLFRAGDSPVFLGASQFWAKMDISARNNPFVNQVWRQLLGESSITSALGLVAEYDTTDIAHVRDTADNTFYLFSRIYPKLGQQWRFFTAKNWASDGYSVTIIRICGLPV